MEGASIIQQYLDQLRWQQALAALRLKQMSWEPMWFEDQIRGIRPGFTDGYDYWNALKYGIRREPGSGGHMPSRVPQTGLLLKSTDHPTFWKTLQGERDARYEVYSGQDGRLYSRPK